MKKYKIECFHEMSYIIEAEWFVANEDNTLTLYVWRDEQEEVEVACFNRAHWNMIYEINDTNGLIEKV